MDARLRELRGWRDPGNAHESYSLGSSTNVPDLTDGDIAVRVVYTPRVTPEDIWHPAFQATAHVGESRWLAAMA